MPLQRQLLQTGFRFGVDEGTEPHSVPWGTLTRAENARWVKGGRLEKRGGVSALLTSVSNGDTFGTARRLFSRNGELCAVIDSASLGSARLYSYGRSAGWRDRGAVPDVGITTKSVVDSTEGVSLCDSAAYLDADGRALVAVAWTSGDPSGITLGATVGITAQIAIVDALTGATVVQPTKLNAYGTYALSIRVVYVNSTIVVAILKDGGTISAWSIPTSTYAIPSETTLRTDAYTVSLSGFDMCVVGTGICIGYNNTTPVFKLYTYTSALAAINNASVVATADNNVALACNGTEIVSSVNSTLYRNDATTLSAIGSIALPGPAISIASTSAGSAVICYSLSAAAGTSTVYGVGTCTYQSGSIVATSKRVTWGVRAISRVWAAGTRFFMVLCDDQPSGPPGPNVGGNTYVVECEFTTFSGYSTIPHKYVGKIDQLVGGFRLYGTCGAVTSASGSTYYCAVPFVADGTSITTKRQGIRLASLTLGSDTPADMWRTVVGSGEAYIASGVLSAYDGHTCFDYGFARSPLVVSKATAATGSMAAGTYLYGVCAEYRSKAGVLHRSTTSGLTVSGVPASGKVTMYAALCNVASKQNLDTRFGSQTASPVLVAIFRSVVSGSTLQRLTVEPTANVVLVDYTGSSQQFVDTKADGVIDPAGDALASRPVLYTTGGILDDVQPPALTTLTYHRQRLWGVGPDQRTIWYSKSFSDDQGVAPGFNEAFRIVADQDVVALVSMDDKLVVLYRDGIGYIQGDGPNAAGANGDFTSVIDVQTDVGCSNPRSVVSTPFGVLFQSSRGLYLLTRGLEVVWFGRQVQDVIASYPNVTSATLVPKYSEVRFTANDSAGTSHTVLVWNYAEKQWSTFRYLSGAVGIADACVWNGTWVFVTTTGAAYSESTSTYLDAGAYVSMVLETAWLSAAGPLAFQSCREMQLSGASRSNHDLLVEVAFDSSTSYAQTRTFTAGSAVTAIGSLEECTIAIGTQRKAASIRFRISDLTPTNPGTYPVGTGQGPALDTVGVEVGIKQGFSTNPATKRG